MTKILLNPLRLKILAYILKYKSYQSLDFSRAKSWTLIRVIEYGIRKNHFIYQSDSVV